MQSEVYLSAASSDGTSPRTLALRPCVPNRLDQTMSQGQVIYFALHGPSSASASPSSSTSSLIPPSSKPPTVSVRLAPAAEFHAGLFRKLQSRPVYGCLGLMHHANDTFLALITGCAKVGDIRRGESVYKIIAVRFFSLTGNTPDEDMIPAPFDPEIVGEYDKGPGLMPHPCRELEKVLCNGAFFFSPQIDLTRSIQARSLKLQEKHTADSNVDYDESFLWNLFMLKELLTFRSHLDEQEREELDCGGLLVHAIQGYVGCQSFRTASTQGQLTIISRLSSKRAGTRYNTRGVDDTGNVANFVETETILSNPEWCFAYTQIRGSVPVFWEQQGLQLASHKIQLSRGSDATKPAVRRHFEDLIQKYNEVHIVDLLGNKDQGEITLSQEYRTQVEGLSPVFKRLHMTRFDYHSQVKGGNYDQVQALLQYIRSDSEKYGYFFHDLVANAIVQTQTGIFRTNCLDCLDRTNVIQSNLSKEATETFLHNILPQDGRFANLMLLHSDLWADNGDLLSKIYTGTGALKSDVTRSGKMSFSSLLGDATKSINRFYINNFQDKDRQEVIDILLGKMASQTPVAIHDPVHESIASEMNARMGEYSQSVQIDVFVGTYNLNGKAPTGESLESWLCFDKDVAEPDLYVIGFQEIVKLTPKQIMATDENKRLVWEHEVEKTINRRGRSKYIQLRSGQLVGAALMVYAKEQSAPYIRNVECSIKKTGMGGMAGNKGAVAIRMDYHDTTLCLVTSHLASGQENLQERNNDFHTINDGISFARGRTISGHDIILWCGDFNYRVDMENDQIRALVSQGNYFEIFRCDQLKRSIDYGEAFYGYKEGIIAFAPTYRYDIGTDNYDTSEKYRAPAWTDRVLYRGKGIYQTSYERAEFRTSDHRPVMSMFVLELTRLDAEARVKMEESLYRKSSSKTLTKNGSSRSSNSPTAQLGLASISATQNGRLSVSPEPPGGAPKPSSDTHQWWNDPSPEGVRRLPSNNKNPFLGDRTIYQTAQGAAAATSGGINASRPAPAPPVVAATLTPQIKRPAVDLLGDLDNETAKTLLPVPILGSSGVKGAKSTPPPPPASRRAVTALPASSTIHQDPQATGVRRAAPPPPPKRDGAIQEGGDDDDDDDDDEDDDDYVDVRKDQQNQGEKNAKVVRDWNSRIQGSGNSNVAEDKKSAALPSSLPKLGSTPLQKTTKEAKPSEEETEILLKPSELRKQQQQPPTATPGSFPSTPPSSLPENSVLASKVRSFKKDEQEIIRPRLQPSSSTSSTLPQKTYTGAKVALPGLNPQGASPSKPVDKGSAPSVSKGIAEQEDNSNDSSSGLSVSQRMKALNDRIAGDGVSKSKEAKGDDDDDGDAAIKAQAILDLKKSYGVVNSGGSKPAGGVASVKNKLEAGSAGAGASATTTTTTTAGSRAGPASNDADASSKTNLVTPVIPLTKPLSFATGLSSVSSTRRGEGAGAGAGAGAGGKGAKEVGKVGLPGLGTVQAAKASKTDGETANAAVIKKQKEKEEEEAEDVMPASGSVKQAIAALKKASN